MADMNLETATSTELKQWKKTVDWETAPDGALDQLNELIMERAIKEQVGAGLAGAAQRTRAAELDALALKRWPELKNKESEFYKRTMELIPQGSEDTPGAMLAAANEIGIQVFGGPSGKLPPSGIASGRSADAPGNVSDDTSTFMRNTSTLRSMLVGEGLIKDTPEVMQRIATNATMERSTGEDS
jgi:hypothetical protein